MKDKILNAINKGLLNVLSTDIQDQDIDFNNADIDNEYIPEITLEELYEIYKECNLFTAKYNTKNALSLILNDDSEISLFEYTDDMNPLFIKITNKELHNGNNDILIYIPDNHYIMNNLSWSKISLQV